MPIELAEYLLLIPRHFSPRLESIPSLSDYELRRLSMPVHYVAGDLDALLSTGRSAARLRRLVPHARVDVLPGVGHAVMDIAGGRELPNALTSELLWVQSRTGFSALARAGLTLRRGPPSEFQPSGPC